VEGQYWLDTSVTPNILRQYDGTNWCPFATIDAVGHAAAAFTFPFSHAHNGGI
jgi:hypothetical protein